MKKYREKKSAVERETGKAPKRQRLVNSYWLSKLNINL
jgi:hypothetical protein